MKAVIHFKGKPMSKQHGHRSFTNKNTGKVQYYSTGEYESFKTALGWEAAAQLVRQQWRLQETEPVMVSIQFRADRNIGDISNIIGGIEDALNGVAWRDDCQAILRSCYGMISADCDRGFSEFTIALETFDSGGGVSALNAEAIRAWVADGLKRRASSCRRKK